MYESLPAPTFLPYHVFGPELTCSARPLADHEGALEKQRPRKHSVCFTSVLLLVRFDCAAFGWWARPSLGVSPHVLLGGTRGMNSAAASSSLILTLRADTMVVLCYILQMRSSM